LELQINTENYARSSMRPAGLWRLFGTFGVATA
jgi:hypothetical protein